MKKNIELGEVSLTDEELDFSKGKIRITAMIDMEIYEKLKEEASASGTNYQSILNSVLKELLQTRMTLR